MYKILEDKRKEKRIKVYELANKIGIDSSLMSRILSGKRKPTRIQLKKIIEVLSLDYNEVIKEKMANEIASIVSEYPLMAEEVLMMVQEERIPYLIGEDRFETINIESVEEELNSISELQKVWKLKKPLNKLQLQKMKEYFHTEYTYESNKIEGNTLDFQETHLVVNEGITIGGKSVKEHLEVINHQEAIDFIVDIAKQKVDFTERILKQIHQLILKGIDKKGAGVYRNTEVRISGSRHIPPDSLHLNRLMEDYFEFYTIKKQKLHPVILAAEMHERLVSIHPFIDGNGRTARLVMNLILLQNGYTILSLKGNLEDRRRYYKALESVQMDHENSAFYQLIIERAKYSLNEHIKLGG